MKPCVAKLMLMIFTLLPGIVSADLPADAAYLDGGDNKTGLILCHGRGKNPTWKVVDPLRKGVHEKLGYHTLSIQLPNDDKNWKKYADDFPEAFTRIKDAIRFLKEEKGVTSIYLMGHSMGSRMAGAFLAHNVNQPINGLIIAGCRNNGGGDLNCLHNIENLQLPILDIWGGGERKDASAAHERESLRSKNYIQVAIPNANHRFDNHEDEFVDAVSAWLEKQ